MDRELDDVDRSVYLLHVGLHVGGGMDSDSWVGGWALVFRMIERAVMMEAVTSSTQDAVERCTLTDSSTHC